MRIYSDIQYVRQKLFVCAMSTMMKKMCVIYINARLQFCQKEIIVPDERRFNGRYLLRNVYRIE